MSRGTWVVAALLLVAACSEDRDGVPASGPDAGACDPSAQSGCPDGQKCTWIRAAASRGQQLGVVGCAPAGAVQLGEACRYGAAGMTTGFDDCAAGLVCLAEPDRDRAAGVCRTICDLGALGGACDGDFACGSYVSLFGNRGETPAAGVCDPTCDPLTQVRTVDGAPACGSRDASEPTLGCYDAAPTPNPIAARPPSFSCAVVAGDVRHRREAVDADGDSYTNICAPGHIMGFYDGDDPRTQKVVCLKLCKPGATHSGAPGDAHGVGDHQCAGRDFTDDDECRYWWFFDGSTATFGPSALSNGLGICWRHTEWHYDSDGDRRADTVWPSCRALSDQDDPGPEPEDGEQPDTTPENLEWGCGPLPERAAARAIAPAVRPAVVIPALSRDAATRELREDDAK